MWCGVVLESDTLSFCPQFIADRSGFVKTSTFSVSDDLFIHFSDSFTSAQLEQDLAFYMQT